MNNIKLTENHKSKLLEMCKILFPKQDWQFWESKEEYYLEGMLGYSSYAILGKHKTIQPSLEIHWFEFCCKKLAFQIYNFNIGKTETTYSTFAAECIITSMFNPIDYLYQEFKKLKNE